MTTSVDDARGVPGKWLVPLKRCVNPRLRVLCFPYGGGGTVAYWPWQSELPQDAELWAVRLPGRENRIAEACITDATKVVSGIVGEATRMSDVKCVFYGHSLGAGLAFETANRLRAENQVLPALFVASGRLPPHCAPALDWSEQPENELLDYLSKLGGVPSDLNDRVFRSIYLPMIRADFRLNETLPYGHSPAFDFPITIINGLDDPTVNNDQLPEWGEYTSDVFRSFAMNGDHFFIQKNYREFISLLVEQLAALSVEA